MDMPDVSMINDRVIEFIEHEILGYTIPVGTKFVFYKRDNTDFADGNACIIGPARKEVTD